MVNQYGFVRAEVCFMVLFCSRIFCAASLTDNPILKRQTGSFVVSANYGVHPGKAYNPSVLPRPFMNATGQPGGSMQLAGERTLRNIEPLPTPSAWIGGNFAPNSYEADDGFNPFQPHSQKNSSNMAQYRLKPSVNSGEIILFGTVKPHTPATTSSEEPQLVPSDNHTPTIADLQEMLNKLVKGSTRVHQVVKVPAVYEIHLQQQEEMGRPIIRDNNKAPLPGRPKSPARRPTRTWNLPSKKAPHSAMQSLHYGSVNVPMTPGSTAVTLWDHNYSQGRPNLDGHFQAGAPDLSWYYAKKKELNKGLQSRRRFGEFEFGRNGGRVRYGAQAQIKNRESRGMFMPLNGVSYIVHVREKSS